MDVIWLFSKMLVSGGFAAVTDLSVLYLLTEKVQWGHSVAVNVAFGAGIVVNFLLQKFWTFEHRDTRLIHVQLVKFLLVAVLNMAVNAGAMALLVGVLDFWYLGAQAIVLASLTCLNFIAYRRYIFHLYGEA